MYDGYPNLREKTFCDPARNYPFQTWCEDDSAGGLDHYDATMLCTHGSIAGQMWRPYPCWDPSGAEDCFSYPNVNWRLGDDNLEFLVMMSCWSMQDTDWAAWGNGVVGLHQINGWHGRVCLQCDGQMDDRIEEYVDDAFNMPIATSWTLNLTIWDEPYDMCPVARAEGNTAKDAVWRLNNEQYDDVKSDPTGN